MARGRPPKAKQELASAVVSVENKESADVATLPAYQRENPKFLSGDAIKALGVRFGIAKSECDKMSDEKLRMQINSVIYRRQEEDEVA